MSMRRALGLLALTVIQIFASPSGFHPHVCPSVEGLPCPFTASYSADVTISRKAVAGDTSNDYTAVGKVGITHELTHGAIVYATDMRVTHSADGSTHRAWMANWNFLGKSERRYFVVENKNGQGSCHREEDSNFHGDPFIAIMNRFEEVGDGMMSWNYNYQWGNPGSGSTVFAHQANLTTDIGGSPIQSSEIMTFANGVPVATIRTMYSNIGSSPEESLFWPRNKYPDCDDNKIANFTITGASSVCIGDLLALEYGCL